MVTPCVHEAVELDFGLAGVLSTVTMTRPYDRRLAALVNSIAEKPWQFAVLLHGKYLLTGARVAFE